MHTRLTQRSRDFNATASSSISNISEIHSPISGPAAPHITSHIARFTERHCSTSPSDTRNSPGSEQTLKVTTHLFDVYGNLSMKGDSSLPSNAKISPSFTTRALFHVTFTASITTQPRIESTNQRRPKVPVQDRSYAHVADLGQTPLHNSSPYRGLSYHRPHCLHPCRILGERRASSGPAKPSRLF